MRFAVSSALVLLAAAPLGAQLADSARTGLERGAYSLSFQAPVFGTGGGSGSLGFWRMVSGRTNLGISVRLGAERQEHESNRIDDTPRRDRMEATRVSVAAGPAVRRYFAAGERTAPFVYAGAEIGFGTEARSGTGNADADSRGAHAALEAGVGLEWFAVRTLSVSGYTGVRARAGSFRTEYDFGDSEQSLLELGTFTSALAVNLYLPRRRTPSSAAQP